MSNELTILKVHEVNETSLVKDFLVELMLTKEWNSYQNVLIERDDESESYHISDYAYRLGLLKWSDSNDYKYEVSVKGRKWLDEQS